MNDGAGLAAIACGGRKVWMIGAVSDVLSPDPIEALAIAQCWGLSVIEPNLAEDKAVCDLPRRRLDVFVDEVSRSGVRVPVVGSRAFRSGLDDDESYRRDLDHVRRASELAARLGSVAVRVFSFNRQAQVNDTTLERVAERLAGAAQAAAEVASVDIAIENTSSGNVGRTRETAALLEILPVFGLVWDPANAVAAGDRVPDTETHGGFRHRVVQIHVKDVRIDAGSYVWTPLGTGLGDLPGQLRLGGIDPQRHALVLDTHSRPGVHIRELVNQDLRAVRSLLSRQTASESEWPQRVNLNPPIE